MRTVRLTWKPKLNRKKRAAMLQGIRKVYDTARDHGDYVDLLVPEDDTKFIWIFMLSKAFKDME